VPLLRQITIVGVGLIGGSIGIDVRRRKLAGKVIGVGRRRSSLRAALRKGALDRTTLDINSGVRGSELVVFATSAAKILPLALSALGTVEHGALLTDVASTKGHIARGMAELLKRTQRHDVAYVGSHPLAGSHERGPTAAKANLLCGNTCVLAGSAGAKPEHFALLRRFWRSLGMKVVRMTTERHDRLLAQASHLPHVAAAALINTIDPEALEFTAGGFRDTTRIAASDAGLWGDIFLTNQKSLLRALERYRKQLESFEKAVHDRDELKLRKMLEAASIRRKELE